MRRNKKGFTLTELLAIIALIGIVMVIAVPSVNKINKSAREKELENKFNMIKTAAELCYRQEDDKEKCKYIDSLLRYKYLTPEKNKGESGCPDLNETQYGCIYNPIDKSLMNDAYRIVVSADNNKITITIQQ